MKNASTTYRVEHSTDELGGTYQDGPHISYEGADFTQALLSSGGFDGHRRTGAVIVACDSGVETVLSNLPTLYRPCTDAAEVERQREQFAEVWSYVSTEGTLAWSSAGEGDYYTFAFGDEADGLAVHGNGGWVDCDAYEEVRLIAGLDSHEELYDAGRLAVTCVLVDEEPI